MVWASALHTEGRGFDSCAGIIHRIFVFVGVTSSGVKPGIGDLAKPQIEVALKQG